MTLPEEWEVTLDCQLAVLSTSLTTTFRSDEMAALSTKVLAAVEGLGQRLGVHYIFRLKHVQLSFYYMRVMY